MSVKLSRLGISSQPQIPNPAKSNITAITNIKMTANMEIASAFSQLVSKKRFTSASHIISMLMEEMISANNTPKIVPITAPMMAIKAAFLNWAFSFPTIDLPDTHRNSVTKIILAIKLITSESKAMVNTITLFIIRTS